MVFDNIGLAHLIFSIIAIITGTIVLFNNKGTKFHKKMGSAYAVSMTGLLATAFMIYRLFGQFGVFHVFAVISSVTLIGGILPMVLKRPKSYITLHFNFMYWSVLGLYAAFLAETMVRLPKVIFESGTPNRTFYIMVIVAIFATMGIGNYIFYKKKKDWAKFEQ